MDYENGKIYKLINNVDDKIYVGSTCSTLIKRKCLHKSTAKVKFNRGLYKHLNEIGWDNVDIVWIEDYPCSAKHELHARERYWIKELNAELNRTIPTRTVKEYRDLHKDKIKEYQKSYHKEYREANKEKLKLYREANKEKAREYQKMYRANHNERITCDCGSSILKSNSRQHSTSKKHQRCIKKQSEDIEPPPPPYIDDNINAEQ